MINPGLHVIMSQTSKDDYAHDIDMLLSQLQGTAKAQKLLSLQPTRFVFHDVTSLIDADMREDKRALVNKTMVDQFNAELSIRLLRMLALEGTNTWLRILPTNRLTAFGPKLGLVEPHGDGIHYAGGYQNIVVQLDLYFLSAFAASSFC